MFLNNHFGELLAFYLEKKGINQSWLAKKIGVSHQAMSGYLATRSPRKDTIEKILNALGITLEQLISTVESEKVEEPSTSYQSQSSVTNNISISMEQFQYFMEAVKERDELKQKEIEKLQEQNQGGIPQSK